MRQIVHFASPLAFFLFSAAQPVFVFGPAIVYSAPRVLSSDHWHLASDWSVKPTVASDLLSPIIHSVPCPPDHFTNTNTHSLNNPLSDIPFSLAQLDTFLSV